MSFAKYVAIFCLLNIFFHFFYGILWSIDPVQAVESSKEIVASEEFRMTLGQVLKTGIALMVIMKLFQGLYWLLTHTDFIEGYKKQKKEEPPTISKKL